MKKTMAYILLILWMILIFYLSSQTGVVSASKSGGITYNVLNIIYNTFNIDNSNIASIVESIHGPLREVMHMLEYLILGILTINILKQYNIKYNLVILSIMLCFIYATTDEIHQVFVPGRTFEYFDIFMDMIGTIIGSLISNKIIRSLK